MAEPVTQSLVSAYDCRLCPPYSATSGPVPHYSDGNDDRYGEHWRSRDPESLRHVLMFTFDSPTIVTPVTATMLIPYAPKKTPPRRGRTSA